MRKTGSVEMPPTVSESQAGRQGRRSKSGYLPGLDGWRALAIIGVMMTHDAPWRIGSYTNAAWRGFGGDGVYLFFAVSGLLICWRILEEESLVGRFDLKGFYIRRFCRIQPAALVYLAAIATLMLTGAIHEYWRFWFGALLLYQNFLFHALDPHLIQYGLFTGHFWTLAVEEHFYILLSLLLVSFRRYRIVIFAGLLLAIKVGQTAAMRHGWFSPDVSMRRTYWMIQLLLFPALVALVVRVPRVRGMCERFLLPSIVFPLSLVLVLGHESMGMHHLVLNPLTGALVGERQNIFRLFPFWLVATMLHPRSWTTRLLELPPLRFLGKISYSVYLWHVLFNHLTAGQVSYAPLHVLGTRPWMYLMTAMASCASYYLLEKPFMRLGHRLAPPATAGRLEMLDLPVETPRPDGAMAG